MTEAISRAEPAIRKIRTSDSFATDRAIDELDLVDVVNSAQQMPEQITFMPVLIRFSDNRVGHECQRSELRRI